MKTIPYGHQLISEADIEAVTQVLRSDWLTQGPAVQQFEQCVANYCQSKHATAVSNATAALHLSCLALGVQEGDWVWTSPNTFVASANCALYCGAKVDFVDIDPETFNMSPVALEKKLIIAQKNNTLPKVVIPVHFAGLSCDMQAIKALADKYGFYIIEDASHAIGGSYHGGLVGSCEYSDIAVFSFHPVKIITTGEGGMVLTNNKALNDKVKLLRTHGATSDTNLMIGQKEGGWYYQQIELGFNYRMTDIQAVLGLSQMNRLSEFIKRRNYLASRYNRAFSDLPISSQKQMVDICSAYHLYVIRLSNEAGMTRKEAFDKLRMLGIGVHVHYIPVHLQPYYRQMGFKKNDFPEAERYYREVLTLPLYYSLSDADQDYIIKKFKEMMI